MPTPTVIKQFQYSDSINRREWDETYFEDYFNLQPISAKVGGGAATGTAGDNNVLYSATGQYEYFVIGTQTILAPSMDTTRGGLNLVQDATSGDGIELCMGQTVNTPRGFTIGSSPAFFMQAKFICEDVSGTNPLIIGFRKAQAFDATLANYTDFAVIGLSGTANPNTIQTITNVNGGTPVTTNTGETVADATAFQVAVYVSAAGVVTYKFNYGDPTTTVAFTFDDGDFVIPFIRFTQAADVTSYATCQFLNGGAQS